MAGPPAKLLTEIELLQRDEECSILLGSLEEADKRKLFELLANRMSSLLVDGDTIEPKVEGTQAEQSEQKPSISDNPINLTGHVQIPKIGVFSGDEPLNKGEVTYEHWRHEVNCLVKEEYKECTVLLAIRRSLKGTAATVLLNLGVDISTKDVVEKFNVVFGNILPNEMLLEDFYTARQGDSESVVAWGCRIERLLMKAKEQGTIQGTEDMARTKFWSGIKDEQVKSALRHKFDGGDKFHELLRNARLLEHEFQSKKTKTVKISSQLAPNLDGIEARLSKLEKAINDLVSNHGKGSKESDASHGTMCRYCKKKGHKIEDCRILQNKNERKVQQENSQQLTPGALS